MKTQNIITYRVDALPSLPSLPTIRNRRRIPANGLACSGSGAVSLPERTCVSFRRGQRAGQACYGREFLCFNW